VRFDRQVVAVSRSHEAHYRYLHGELMPGQLAVQPENRDTAQASCTPCSGSSTSPATCPSPCSHPTTMSTMITG
jgi:hypothetical protein